MMMLMKKKKPFWLISFFVTCFQSPPKGATIPYRPKPVNGPVILANGQAFTIQGNYAVPTQDVSVISFHLTFN